ncbi:MAG: hypothetical protein KDI32_06365 [Pseudomonadales bacterium]|nr:hypothetical protein [Pseudomonadales bacterium]
MLALFLACGGASASAANAGDSLPTNAVRVQRIAIMDRNGFEQPIAAAFGLIPVGWRAQGGVQWGAQFGCTNGYNINWTASSPDGTQTLGILPLMRWEANNYGAASSQIGCPSASMTTVQQLLETLIRQLPYGARPLDYRPRADLVSGYAHLNNRTPTPMGETRTWVESGEMLFGYQDKGRDMRGIVTAAVFFTLMHSTGLGSVQSMDVVSGATLSGFVATAPNGQLRLAQIEALRQSFIPNPAWMARITKHNTAIARSAAAEAYKQGQIIAETNDYVSALRAQVQANRDRSSAYIARERGEAMRGVETYTDTYAPGGTVELSGYYNNAWRLNDGSYVLSDDRSFDPWRDLGLAGQKLEPTR